MAKLRVKGGVPEWCIEHMIFCQCFSGSLMILFMRDDCGPIEMVNKTSFASKLERKKKKQFLSSAQQWMEVLRSATGSYRSPRRLLREPLR